MSSSHASAPSGHDEAARPPIATPPEAELHEQAVHASHVPDGENAEHPRREVKAPEGKKIEHHAKAFISDVPVKTPVAVNDDLLITDALRNAANENLATFIADKISPGVIDESLRIKLVEDVGHGYEGVKICLSGLKLEGNHALIGQQMEQALQQHPVFAPLFAHAQNRPHFKDDPAQPNMVHIHVPQLSIEQYHAIFEALAKEPLVAPHVPSVPPINVPRPGATVVVPPPAAHDQADIITHPPIAPGHSPREQDAAPNQPVSAMQHDGVLQETQKEAARA